jgi:5-dehydro-2-deoxygluconokinase
LFRAADHGFWIGRPVEEPGARPLDFEFGGSLGAKLVEWPLSHSIKCLCFYHPGDAPEMKARQERELLRLYDAARTIGRELLVEIIASKHGSIDEATIATVIERLYAIGIKPDWWKLESQASAQAWKHIAAAIASNDPYCRGIVLLGLEASEEQLATSFATARSCDLVKGFAVGRTIFAEPARAWLAGQIDDAAAVDQMARSFARLCKMWQDSPAWVEQGS